MILFVVHYLVIVTPELRRIESLSIELFVTDPMTLTLTLRHWMAILNLPHRRTMRGETRAIIAFPDSRRKLVAFTMGCYR